MKKLFVTITILVAGLSAVVTATSCEMVKTDYTGLLLLLATKGARDSGGPNIYLFEVTDAHNGDFDANDNGNAREELDALARNAYTASHTSLGCTQIHAFISVSGSSEIRDLLPGGKPVYGPTGTDLLIATDKSDLLDGSILMSLFDAGVTAATYYWTGSTQAGALYGFDCNGWTSSAAVNTFDDWAEHGSTSSTGVSWIAAGQYACSNTYALLGVCW